MNHYPRHIGDWMVATAHLSEIEECMYSRLIDAYYAREAPLPREVPACCRLVRASSAAARKAVDDVLHEFFDQQEDGWHQKRCDEELARYREKSAKARDSINARWSKRNTDVHTDVIRTYTERNTNQNQNHKKATTSAPSVSLAAEGWEGITADDLSTWAKAYPALSLEAELQKARAWAVANPKNRKQNWRRFINGWLGRAQERAPRVAGPAVAMVDEWRKAL